MAKIFDVTEKLGFENEYQLKIRDTILDVNGDAETVVKIMGIISEGADNPASIMAAADLLFPDESRKKLSDLRLSFIDYSEVITSAVNMVTGTEEPAQGEAPTRAMT